MGLYDKIENIRQKPEHIRLRYAWACAIAGTFCVILVWFLSLKARQPEVTAPQFSEEQLEVFNELGEQKKSLQEVGGKMKETIEKENTKQEEF